MDRLNYRELTKKIKTPFYVFDEVGFVENYHALDIAMKGVYSNYQISYSYKTNYTPYICKVVKELGGYAEVVSDMELALALKLGYEHDRIVYNGPAKGDLLKQHILNGGITNIDNYGEARRICKIAEDTDKKIKVGLRINLHLDDAFISRFGFDVNSEDYENVLKLIVAHENVEIVGLHCHISRHRGIDAWKKRAELMIDVADKLFANVPEYISLGSGMFADMEESLKSQFSDVPTYEEYAIATMTPFAKRYNGDKKPVVFTEPGTTLVARYLNFVSMVLDVKTILNKNIATMDGCYENLGETCTLKQLPVRVLKGDKTGLAHVDMMGYTCLEQDLMYKNYEGEIAEGDIVVFGNVGGYSIVFKPQFIRPNCAMYSVTNSSVKKIMRAETFEDIFGKFAF